MKSVCAWCKTVLDGGEVQEDAYPVTHGICLRCAQEFFSDLSESMRDFLDRLGVPVLLLDDDPIVRTANAQARELLGKDLSEIEDRRGGEVIECVHAFEPGGCGRQVHCQGCTIRRLVLQTHETGQSFTRIPAYPNLQSTVGVKKKRVEISTEKVGKVVLLRLHGIQEVDPSVVPSEALRTDSR